MYNIQQEIDSLNTLLEDAKKKLAIYQELRILADESRKSNSHIFLTPEEVTTLIGGEVSLLDNKRHKSNGVPYFKINGLILYDLADILDYIDSCKYHSTAEYKAAQKAKKEKNKPKLVHSEQKEAA